MVVVIRSVTVGGAESNPVFGGRTTNVGFKGPVAGVWSSLGLLSTGVVVARGG